MMRRSEFIFSHLFERLYKVTEFYTAFFSFHSKVHLLPARLSQMAHDGFVSASLPDSSATSSDNLSHRGMPML